MYFFLNKFLFFILVFSGTLAQAQESTSPKLWTLEECIDYALKNNISIQQTQLNTDVSKINLTQSEGNLLPSINASAGHNYNIGRTIDRFTNQFADQQVLSQNMGVSADITLFGGLQNINMIKQNKYAYMAGKFDVDKIKNDVSLNIATAYLQILYSIELVDNARNQMGITESQVIRAKKLLDAGSVAKGNLLDIQAQLANEELNYTSAQNQLDIAYLTLAQLMNLENMAGFTILKPELAIAGATLLDVNPTQIYNTAMSNLPEIKSAELKVKSADKAVDAAWGGLSPRLSFNASYGTGYSGLSQRLIGQPTFAGYYPNGSVTNSGDMVLSPLFTTVTEKTPFTEQYKNNVNKTFGFYLTVPIFNRLQTKTSIDRAHIQKLTADLTVQSTKQQVLKNIQQAYADANAGLKKYHSAEKAVAANAESFKYVEQKFNVGMMNTNDYSIAKNKLIKAQSDLLQAKYEYVFKTKVLDFYQGKPLKL